jgi:hypothetical protein
LNSRTESGPTLRPSNFASFVNRTVRMGMFTPTPSVSVPEMTLSRPCCESCSTSSRYFGRSPAWWMPMPERSTRPISLPYGVSNAKSPSAAPMRARSSRVATFALVSACASSAASRCVNDTTYTGARPSSSSASTVSWSGVSR